MKNLVLGTVQFGLNYGLTNKDGQVNIEEVFKILDYARANGVNTLDTASAYGEAEKILGSYNHISDFNVITKGVNTSNEKGLRDSIEKSLLNLNSQSLYAYLIHKFDDLKHNRNLVENLNAIKSEGFLKKIGVSLYNPEELEFILDNDTKLDIVQIPLNIFDQRFLAKNLLTEAKRKGIEIHIRSIYLQGLLLQPVDKLDLYFKPYIDLFERYSRFLKDNKINRIQAVCNFNNNLDFIDSIVFGVCSQDQLQDFIINNEISPCEKLDFSQFSSNIKDVIDPLTWKKNGLI
ncbi:aldo/keto reductase [Bacteriovorax sp. Seq25_V]|uniref:aldo/keto reductase n=1 Tax=Bacteriovorax sp. Seq25_V TaxID=1201288 RepID=UPI000389ED1E|nr:aldo/keto reductase [Bacteriovorax sp. Seq25_V]EQC43412.1 oxidoreductase, aldo/keto reductase family protein [Bacteriovorax sp. Seq25_V]